MNDTQTHTMTNVYYLRALDTAILKAALVILECHTDAPSRATASKITAELARRDA